MKKMTYLFLLAATLGACSPKELAFASGRTDSDCHRRKRLLSGKGEAYTSVESRRCSRYSGRCGALARSGSRQRIHAYSYQYKSSFGCYTVV